MDGATTDCGAFDETVVFLSHFKDLHHPRQQGKVTYPLDEVLLLCLLGVLAGAEAFTEIALFGVKKLAFLHRFRLFKDGTRTTSTSATSRRCWTPSSSSSASSHGCRADRHSGRRDRHRWQDRAPVQEHRQSRHPHCFRLRRPPASRARPGQGGGKVQRDHRDLTDVPPRMGSASHTTGSCQLPQSISAICRSNSATT